MNHARFCVHFKHLSHKAMAISSISAKVQSFSMKFEAAIGNHGRHAHGPPHPYHFTAYTAFHPWNCPQFFFG